MPQPNLPELDELMREIVLERLAALKNNRIRTAHSLGICIRTLRIWLGRWSAAGHTIPPPTIGRWNETRWDGESLIDSEFDSIE